MTRLIDLSHTILHDMPVYPYDDPVKLYQDKYLDADGYSNFQLEMGMHSGTHIDTPMHLTGSEMYVSDMSLDFFMGKGCLLDVRGESVIGFKEEYSKIVSEQDVVLLYTNHSASYGTEKYYTQHPIMDENLADFFIQKRVKMLGMDLPSPDRYPFRIHRKLLSHNILIIENLTNLSALLDAEEFEIMAFPLKIMADASVVRVVARIDKER